MEVQITGVPSSVNTKNASGDSAIAGVGYTLSDTGTTIPRPRIRHSDWVNEAGWRSCLVILNRKPVTVEPYYRSDGVTTFEEVFEPDAAGPTIPGYYNTAGALMRFAPRSAGSKATDIKFRNSANSDITNIWAAKGSVSYTVASLADIGSLMPIRIADHFSMNVGSRVLARNWLVIKRDGTWEYWLETRNFIALTVRDNAGGTNQLYPVIPGTSYNGLKLQSGTWAKTPSETFGDNYTVDFVKESSSYGRWWIPSAGQSGTFQTGGYYGAFNVQEGSWLGLGNNLPLTQDRQVELNVDMTATGNNGSYRDPPGGLRRFNRGTVLCRIKRLGTTVLEFRFSTCTINSWADITAIVYEPGYGGVGGGGVGGGGVGGVLGGGGCVSVSAKMYNGERADSFTTVDKLLITDPYASQDATKNSNFGQIRRSIADLQPMVRIKTKTGASLPCSTTAPIPTKENGFVLAPDLLGHYIPVAKKADLSDNHTPFIWDEVIDIENLGLDWVQNINVDETCFWASEDGELFILHHNAKNAPDLDENPI